MYWEVELILYLLLLTTAVLALHVRDLLAAVVCATVFSLLMALLFVAMGAIDVGFTEAVVGAGVTGVFFILALFMTSRRTVD
jgi:energy-converting hydrogenase B subunit D